MQSAFLKHSNPTQHKRDQMRDQIRSKQIEEYKNKIRKHYSRQCPKTIDSERGQHSSSRSYYQQNHSFLNTTTNEFDESSLQNIEHSLSSLLSSNSHIDFITNEFRLQFDTLINNLIIIEDQNCGLRLTSPDRQHFINILAMASKFGNEGVQLWTIEQRCILSHYWHLLLKATLADTTHIHQQGQIESGLKQINNALLYVSHFLTKNSQQNNHGHNAHKCSVFDFTETEQQILQLTVSYFVELLFIIAEPNSQNFITDQPNCTANNNCLPHRCQDITNKLLYLYTLYIRQAMQQFQIGSIATEQDHHHLEIGNIKIQVIKSVIKVAIEGIFGLKEYHSSDIGSLKQTIADSINYLCGLFNQFSQTLHILPVGYLTQVENQASSQETFLGLLVSLCELVLTMACEMEVHESQDSLTIGNESSSFFQLIHNSDIITSLMDLLKDSKLYDGETVAELCSPNNSQLSTYVLTCIFTEVADNQHPHRLQRQTQQVQSYEVFRQSQMKIRQKNTMELKCLKIVSLFTKQYGINLDQEGNLGLRYLNRRADGLANQYYFNMLANIH